MSTHPTDFQGDIFEAVRAAIVARIPDAAVTVVGGGGHFSIEVISPVFAGKGMLESQRLVLGAIAHLMKGDQAPVHAVDQLKTRAP
jgi:acid stress-induced BolA-like protein IbaG/YrbA